MTYSVREHFAACGDVDFFDEQVMCLGSNILQSPIERVTFAFLKLENYGLNLSRSEITTVLPGDAIPAKVIEERGIAVCPQHQVEGYFLDFAVFINTGKYKLAFDFECDGIKFHGANNTQIRHDWNRDIAVSSKGFQIYRVSGSQISRNALWAVEQFGLEVQMQISKLG